MTKARPVGNEDLSHPGIHFHLVAPSASSYSWLLLPVAAFFKSHNRSGTSWETFRIKFVWGFVTSNSTQSLFETLLTALPEETLARFSPRPTIHSVPTWASLSGRGHLEPLLTCWLDSQLEQLPGCQQQEQCKIWLKRELLLWFCKQVRGSHLKTYLFANSMLYYGRRCPHLRTAIPSSGWLDWIHLSCHSSG